MHDRRRVRQREHRLLHQAARFDLQQRDPVVRRHRRLHDLPVAATDNHGCALLEERTELGTKTSIGFTQPGHQQQQLQPERAVAPPFHDVPLLGVVCGDHQPHGEQLGFVWIVNVIAPPSADG